MANITAAGCRGIEHAAGCGRRPQLGSLMLHIKTTEHPQVVGMSPGSGSKAAIAHYLIHNLEGYRTLLALLGRSDTKRKEDFFWQISEVSTLPDHCTVESKNLVCSLSREWCLYVLEKRSGITLFYVCLQLETHPFFAVGEQLRSTNLSVR